MRIITLLLLAAFAAVAQTPARPAIPCSDLRSLTNNEMSIAYAVAVAESAAAPAHCRVSGQILPQVQFEVNLPAQWNGKLYMSGNGGYAGNALDSAGTRAAAARTMRRGFATVSTDTGHQAATEPNGTFAVDRQKLLDYAFRSLHVTAMAAKSIVQAYYGAPASRSYYEGCSTGGRQGLILAQRFPNDFDGIIAGAPVLNFSGTMVSYTRMVQALKAGPILSAKLPLLAEKIYAGCDAKDGLKDGQIDDPRKCDFKPARDLPKCESGERSDCFTVPQIAALETIYSDVMVQGKRFFPGWAPGAEIAGSNGQSGWAGWFIRDEGPSAQVTFAQDFFRYLAPAKPDPQLDLFQVNLDRDVPKLETIHQILDATDPDLTRFRDRGGKLLMHFGWADPALNPYMGVEYYQQVEEMMGPATTNFARVFMAPGMFHCGGGVGPASFDALQPLMDWVEKGIAPASIVASRMVQGKADRTRPLCPYPEVAKYKGSGSTDDAANFTCVRP